MTSSRVDDLPHARSWPFFNTPLRVYLAVMAPICALMTFLIIVPQRPWVRATAGVVLAASVYGLLRGYVRRLVVGCEGVRFRTLAGGWTMRWADVKRIDIYVPSGAVNGVRYVYVTRHDRAPRGRWEIDSSTFQVQDRPGLLDSLTAARQRALGHERR